MILARSLLSHLKLKVFFPFSFPTNFTTCLVFFCWIDGSLLRTREKINVKIGFPPNVSFPSLHQVPTAGGLFFFFLSYLLLCYSDASSVCIHVFFKELILISLNIFFKFLFPNSLAPVFDGRHFTNSLLLLVHSQQVCCVTKS